MVPFLVVARYRSGSNAVSLGLAAHPGIDLGGELLNPSRLASSPDHCARPHDEVRSALTPRVGVDAVGFKLMYEQGTPVEFDPLHWGPNASERLLNDLQRVKDIACENGSDIANHFDEVWRLLRSEPSLRVVHVRRCDQLAAYVSLQLALGEDNWLRNPYETETITLDPDDFRRWCERGALLDAEYRDLFSHCAAFTVEFEDLVSDYEGSIRAAHQFLGVEPLPVRAPIQRQRRSSLVDLVANYEELASLPVRELPYL